MAGLVLEGGSFRGLFTAGVMDALLDYDVNFPYVIGVSAGISNAASYISKQRGRNLEIVKKYRHDARYISVKNFIGQRSLFGLDFVFDDVPNRLMPFDWDTYKNYEGAIRVGVTDVETGKIMYKDGKEMDEKCTLLRATCAMPFCFPPITLNKKQYVDGGLADSIPIRQSIIDGNQKNLVVLTQPKGFVLKASKYAKAGTFAYRNKFPSLAKSLKNRPQMYNETIDLINKIEENTPEDIVVLRPAYKLKSFESDVGVLEQTYKHGYDLAAENIDNIRNLVK